MTRLYRRPERSTKRRQCFACRRKDNAAEVRVLHFNLSHSGWMPGRDRPTMRGAGSIDLCRTCWLAAKAASRLRVGKPHTR